MDERNAAQIRDRFHFSRLLDFELAPVVRTDGHGPFRVGGRVELGVGFASSRAATLMPYYTLYVGYELHTETSRVPADHTLQLGTRLAMDWAPSTR